MHADARQQETLNRTRADSPACAGLSSRHVLPFHACADAGLRPTPWPPTSTQLPGRGQDRSLSERAAGAATCRQELPFHAMALSPMAMQLDALGQETMARPVLGGRVSRQVLPFHLRALPWTTVPEWLA